ncbi:thiolase family protein [Brevibacillus choshinensis]|uniref:thiolase family protein n=1 Tax=Brevibacillus choshinensis TaxID=54911 RepID=UPI002E1C1E1A|nr:thiolase family protein [Brevibacillus choshinensis]
MNEAVLVSAVRTPIAKVKGALKDMQPAEYGALVIREALQRANLQGEEVDDVIFGNCLNGGGNIARLSALMAGMPVSVAGLTIDRQCGSGINSVALAAEAIRAGSAGIMVAGGTESMTRIPFLMESSSQAYDRTPPKFVRRELSPPSIGNPPMGITAENLVERYGISREEQDEFSFQSQQKMRTAMEAGIFAEQILPVSIPSKKGESFLFDTDEHPRPDSTLAALARLQPAFKQGGTVTAGNSSGVNDGAAALVLMDSREAEKRGLEPLARVTGWAVAGVDPNIMGIGPVPATQKLLAKMSLTMDDIDLVEINEAFAAQVIACDRELHFDPDRVNVTGGAIAHGHPIAATGSMLVTKLAYELKRRGSKRGLVTACIGGGQGIALMIER